MSSKALHIFARIDDVMRLLMEKLSIEIPKFQLKRYAKLQLGTEGKDETVSLSGIDYMGGPYQIFKELQINGQKKSKIRS